MNVLFTKLTKSGLTKIVIFYMLGVIFVLLSFESTHWIFSEFGFYWYKYFFRGLLIAAVFFFVLMGFWQLNKVIKSELAKNTLTVFHSIFVTFLLVELVIMIIPYSIGGSNTLVGKSWYHLYWEKNALGFRDPEPEKIYDHSKKNLVILGDSFAAGQGIKDPENRFVNLLRTRFNNDFNVFCVSKLGANTPEAISFLKVFPYSPDVVILAHTPNDIQRVVSKDRISALKGDTLNVSKIPMPKPATHYFTEHAFSINLFSFILFLKKQRDQYARSAQGGQGLEIFFQNKANRYNYLGYYLEPELIDLHLSNIISLRTLYPETKLIVLLFPNLNEITIDYSDRNVNQSIIKALAATDIASINLTPLISFLPEKQRIVNKYNFHPSEAIHKMVADTLGTFLTLQKKE